VRHTYRGQFGTRVVRLHTPRANRKLGAMAHIRKVSRTGKGGGRRMAYEVRYRDPARRERSRTFARKVDAERFVATIETDVARGQYIDPLLGKMFFGEFAREWLATTGHLKPKTREGYESILRTHLLPTFGGQPIAKVRPVEVGRFFSDLAAGGMSVSRMRQTKNVLKRIFDEAVRNGLPCSNSRRSNSTSKSSATRDERFDSKPGVPARVLRPGEI